MGEFSVKILVKDVVVVVVVVVVVQIEIVIVGTLLVESR
jgi:hypothetical protein